MENAGQIKKIPIIFMDLGHGQQQHPFVHWWGVSRWRVHGYDCWPSNDM